MTVQCLVNVSDTGSTLNPRWLNCLRDFQKKSDDKLTPLIEPSVCVLVLLLKGKIHSPGSCPDFGRRWAFLA